MSGNTAEPASTMLMNAIRVELSKAASDINTQSTSNFVDLSEKVHKLQVSVDTLAKIVGALGATKSKATKKPAETTDDASAADETTPQGDDDSVDAPTKAPAKKKAASKNLPAEMKTFIAYFTHEYMTNESFRNKIPADILAKVREINAFKTLAKKRDAQAAKGAAVDEFTVKFIEVEAKNILKCVEEKNSFIAALQQEYETLVKNYVPAAASASATTA